MDDVCRTVEIEGHLLQHVEPSETVNLVWVQFHHPTDLFVRLTVLGLFSLFGRFVHVVDRRLNVPGEA